MPDEPEKLNFLPDDPIESDEQDEFQHTEYVDALERVLESVEEPWHIGIFGKWGSGKSSIIQMLFDRIKEKDTDGDTVCIEFDAWKHAEDSVRTELLLTLDRELGDYAGEDNGLVGEDEITGQLYDVDEQKQIESDGFIEGAYNFITNSTHLIIIIILLSLAAIMSSFLGFDGVATSLLILIAAPLLVFMAEQLQTATTTMQRKFVYPRKEWSGAYERIFRQLINKAREETGTSRIVISIDNLDRCQSRTVYEVLVSLKTFMDCSPCIYIIPCDDDALKSHIQQIDKKEGSYFTEGQNTQEFLRKFFQTTIRIPPMLAEDIEGYAETQNARLKEPYEPEVLDVLTKAYIKTPRRIKQGLNRVTALYILAQEIEESDAGLKKGRITNHTAFLAKMIVLEEDYPEFYSALRDDRRLLDDVNQFFTGNLSGERENKVKGYFARTEAKTSDVSDLRRFLKATRQTTVSDIKPFLHLSEPQYIGTLDKNFVQLLRTNQTDEVKKVLDEVDEDMSEPFAPHCKAIENIIEEYDEEGRDQALFSTIETILEVFGRFDESAQRRIADAVGTSLALRTEFVEDFRAFDLVWLLDRISDKQIRTNLFDGLAQTVVVDNEWQKSRLEALAAHTHDAENNLDIEEAPENLRPIPSKARQALSDQLLRLPKGDTADDFQDSEFGEALDAIRSYGPAWGLLTDDLFEPLISAIEREEGNSEFLNADFYVRLDEGASPRVRGLFVGRLLDYIPNKTEDRAGRTHNNLAEHLLEIKSEIDESSADELYEYIQEVVESKETDAIEIVETGFHFYESASDETQEQFHDKMAEFIDNWGGKHARKSINWADKYGIRDFFEDTDIFMNYMSHVPGKFSNRDNVTTAVSQFSRKFDSELNEDVERLIKSSDDDERKLGAEIFSTAPELFADARKTVVDRCLSKSRRAETEYRQSYLGAVAIVYENIEESDQQTFIDRLDGFLDEGTSKDYQAFRKIWEDIDGGIEPRYQRQIADSIIGALEHEGQPPENLITVFYSLHDAVEDNKLQRCIELMMAAVGDANDSEARSIFNVLANCPDFEGLEDTVLTRIESYLDQNKTRDNTKEVIRDVLASVEERGNPDKDRVTNIRNDYL